MRAGPRRAYRNAPRQRVDAAADTRIHVRVPALEADARHAVALALLQYTTQVTESEEKEFILRVDR